MQPGRLTRARASIRAAARGNASKTPRVPFARQHDSRATRMVPTSSAPTGPDASVLDPWTDLEFPKAGLVEVGKCDGQVLACFRDFRRRWCFRLHQADRNQNQRDRC